MFVVVREQISRAECDVWFACLFAAPVHSVASSQASLGEDGADEPEDDKPSLGVHSGQGARGMYLSQTSGSSGIQSTSRTATSTSTAYPKESINSTVKTTGLLGQPPQGTPVAVTSMSLQHKGAPSLARSDQQHRSAFQPPASSQAAGRHPGHQNFQSSPPVFVSGSTVQYGAPSISPAHQAAAAALKRADAKTGHPDLPPEAAALQMPAGRTSMGTDEVEYPLQVKGQSATTVPSKSTGLAAFGQKPGDVPTSLLQSAVVSSESGSTRPGFAQFLSMSSSSLPPGRTSSITSAAGSTVTTAVTSTQKSIPPTKPYTSSTAMTSVPFTFSLDSLSKSVSSSKPSMSTANTQAQSAPSVTSTFKFEMPAIFTSTSSSGSSSPVVATSVPPSTFSFGKPENSSGSSAFSMKLPGTTEAGTTATSSSFSFSMPPFGIGGDSMQPFKFAGISSSGPVVAQEKSRSTTDLSNGHQSDPSCPASDSSSDTDITVPPTYVEQSAPQGRPGEEGRAPDPAETAPQALAITTTHGSASVIPHSAASLVAVPAMTSTVSVDTGCSILNRQTKVDSSDMLAF